MQRYTHYDYQKIYSESITTANKVTAKELTKFQRDCNAFLSETGDSHIHQLFGKAHYDSVASYGCVRSGRYTSCSSGRAKEEESKP